MSKYYSYIYESDDLNLKISKITEVNMNETEDASTVFRTESRFWIQRVLVPILVCIGAAGNIITVIVLTRRRMRSSTNAYLTALAVTDIIYLFFILLLSFQHYPNINAKKYELFWRFYGISHWLCDSASNASVWLTVSFTIERYIVVCHPMKGKVLCTEGRAKSIIAVVSIVCLVVTATTPFEHQLAFQENCERICDLNDLEKLQPERANQIKHDMEVAKNRSLNSNSSLDLDSSPAPEDIFQINCTKAFPSETIIAPVDEDTLLSFTNSTSHIFNTVVNIMLMNTSCCAKVITIATEFTALGNNRTYRAVFYWFTAIVFGVLPLAMIATFNCFLVNAVYTSHKKRTAMTNSHENKCQSQENRITVLLIAIVVLFLICQLPTALFLIYSALVESKDKYTNNIKMGLGNIFNTLQTLNASCNFILYCALSDKYRQTFNALFFSRGLKDTDSIKSNRTSLRFSRKKLIKRGKSDYTRTPRNMEVTMYIFNKSKYVNTYTIKLLNVKI